PRGTVAGAVAASDRGGAGRRRLAGGAGARGAGGVRRGAVPGAGAAPAPLPVGARGLPVPGDVRQPVRVGDPARQPAVRPGQPLAARPGRPAVDAAVAGPLDALGGGLDPDRLPAVPVRLAAAV